jgi:hypothetical protein
MSRLRDDVVFGRCTISGARLYLAGLADVHVPIQLWRGADDPILRDRYFAQAVYDALPTKSSSTAWPPLTIDLWTA